MRTARRKVCSSKAARKRYGVALSQAVRLLVQPLRLALQQRLKMVVRVHPRRIDHAVAGIDLSLFRQRRQAADGGNLCRRGCEYPARPAAPPLGQTAEDGMGILIINDMASLLRV